MLEWNLSLTIGLAGIAVSVLGAMGLILLAMNGRRVPRGSHWPLVGLFFMSVSLALGSQVDIISKLSSGAGDYGGDAGPISTSRQHSAAAR